MLIKYFHDSPLAGNLRAFKTLHKVAMNFWWPQMRADVFRHVRNCYLCQRGKPAPNTRVGLHAAEPSSKPLEKLFVDFVGPLTRTKRGNSVILVVLDSFPKLVGFFPVRRMASSVVIDCLEKGYFPAYGTPTSIVTDNARVFRSKEVKDLCFRWGLSTFIPLLITPRLGLRSELTGTSNQRWKYSIIILRICGTKIFHIWRLRSAPHYMRARSPLLIYCFWGVRLGPPCFSLGFALPWGGCEVRRSKSYYIDRRG